MIATIDTNQRVKRNGVLLMALAAVVVCVCCGSASSAVAADKPQSTIDAVQPKIVKLYGAGGLSGLESYQSGCLITAEGHILTVFSYVLDSDEVDAVLSDGRHFTAKLLAADPRLDLAVLKIEATGLPHFTLADAVPGQPGMRVLAFSNLFGVAAGDEPASVQHGIVAATTNLAARSGSYETPYKGPVYVLDAMTNNPGAAGGALTDTRGRLLGMLGKELRNSQTNIWLNYALPVETLRPVVDDMLAGKYVQRSANETVKKPKDAWTLSHLGLVLVPDVLDRTPPFVDAVRPGSPAAKAGLRADDLVLYVNVQIVQSISALRHELEYADALSPLKLVVLRGQELVEVSLTPEGER